MAVSSLEALKISTTVVADTANFTTIEKYKPQDSTTNPSLILQAIGMDKYNGLVEDAIKWGREQGGPVDHIVENILDRLSVLFGYEILKSVPGRVSTEVDAKYSFDREATVQKARKLIAMYKELGVGADRVYIKIASTYEGIQAAEMLEREGINCNLTLLFSFAQAVAAADAGCSLISPFVGRILDWYKKVEGREYAAAEDPGVLSVKRIYNYYKKYGYKTIVMGASFRNIGEIRELAGIDYLTISPALLEELSTSSEAVERRLSPDRAGDLCKDAKIIMDEKTFRWMMNEDAMASEKLAEGIRNFSRDTRKLETTIRQKLQA